MSIEYAPADPEAERDRGARAFVGVVEVAARTAEFERGERIEAFDLHPEVGLEVAIEPLQQRAAAGEQDAIELDLVLPGLRPREHHRRLDHREQLADRARERATHLLRLRRTGASRAVGRRHVGEIVLELARLRLADVERRRERLVEQITAAGEIAREEQIAVLRDRDVRIARADVQQQRGAVGFARRQFPRVEDRDRIRRVSRERLLRGGEHFAVRRQDARFRERQHDRVVGAGVRSDRDQVEVGDQGFAGLIDQLLDLEGHQLPELPIGHRRHLRVADHHVAAGEADARAARDLRLFQRRAQLPARGARLELRLRVERDRDQRIDHECSLLLRAGDHPDRGRTDVDSDGEASHDHFPPVEAPEDVSRRRASVAAAVSLNRVSR
jgi:hypothetical protein